MRPPRFRRWAIAAAAVAFAGLIGWQWRSESQAAVTASATAAATAQGASAGDPSRAPGMSPFGAAGPQTNQQKLSAWQQRFVRAEQVYHTYRESTRYPPDSRPLTEHPDQIKPFEPITEDVPLRDASGKPAQGMHIRTTQDRVFVAGAESAKFTIEAVDENGRILPLTIIRSSAQSMPDTRALMTLVRTEVPFTDSGAAPDDVAGDNRFSGVLVPAQQGYAQRPGTIRVLVEVSAKGQKGIVPFDVIYTPGVPATWSGTREAQENGSLSFYLKAQVNTPGRYLASARVFDAKGVPLALLQFNDVVAAPGPAEFKLTLAGALVRDRNPTFPLRLVDVEGFLLVPDTFPDRAMMPRQAGEVHVSKTYPVASFSEAEWESEERARYLAEYSRDMEQALAEMAKLRK